MESRPAHVMVSRCASLPILIIVLLFTSVFGIRDAAAYTVTIATGTKAAYLRIGDGTIGGGFYNAGGTPAANTTVNLVSVTVPAASVGNATVQNMTGTGRLTSDLDGFAFCNAGQVYVGAFFRLPTAAVQNATLRVTTPATLTSAGGDTIPITQISWTSSRQRRRRRTAVPGRHVYRRHPDAGHTATQHLGESCHSFRYANAAIVAAGTYNARATYTLATP